MTLYAIPVGIGIALGVIGLVGLAVTYMALLSERPPQLGVLHRLVVSGVFALSVAAIVTSLLGHLNLLLAGGIGLMLGLQYWLWLDSLMERGRTKRRRDGSLRPAPRPKGEGLRRGRA